MPDSPFSNNGSLDGADTEDEGAVCSCGAGPHPSNPGMCARGHFVRGNSAAVVHGSRSLKFWRDHDEMRGELVAGILADKATTREDASEALILAADALSQAAIVCQSAYSRMAESGGPLSSSGKARRCYSVWSDSVVKVERLVKLIGLEKAPAPTKTLDDWVAEQGAKGTGNGDGAHA